MSVSPLSLGAKWRYYPRSFGIWSSRYICALISLSQQACYLHFINVTRRFIRAVNGSFESPPNGTWVWPYEWELRRSPTVRKWRPIGLNQQRSSHAMLSSAIEANLEIEKRSGVSPPLASGERAAPCLDRTQRVPCADACFGWQLHKRNRTSAAAVQACVSSNF